MEPVLNFRQELAERRSWQARNIFSADSGKGPWYVFFRKTFDLDAASSALLELTADLSYKLYLNGTFIGEGPARSGYSYWSYDTWDVAPYLRKGVNCIAVLVARWDPSGAQPPSLLAQLNLKNADGTGRVIGTDRTWKMRTALGWRHDAPTVCWLAHLWTGYVEVRDLRSDDADWILPNYDDSAWQPSLDSVRNVFFNTETGSAYGKALRCLIKRDIPFLRSQLIRPVALLKAGEVRGTEVLCAKDRMGEFLWAGLDDIEPAVHCAVTGADEFIRGTGPLTMPMLYEGAIYGRILWQSAVVLDFGELCNAYIRLDITAPAGAVIDVSYAQTFIDGKVRHYTGGIYRVNRYILREGRQQIESYEYTDCRYVQITIVETSAPVQIHEALLRSVTYPVDQKAQFSCSDDLLEWVWHAHERTERVCMMDMFMDNTWREKNGWSGDCTFNIIAALTHYGQLDIMRRYFRNFIYEQYPWGGIPSVSPWGEGDLVDQQFSYVIRLRDYYCFTGDRLLIEELYAGLRRFLSYAERFEGPGCFITDFAGGLHIDWTFIDLRRPSVILNFLYYHCLKAMEDLAREFDHPQDAEIIAAKSRSLAKVLSSFWNEEKGAFPDCTANAPYTYSEDTNALALLADFVSSEQKTRILGSIFCYPFDVDNTATVVQSSPSIAYYVMLALCRNGRVDRCLDFIRIRYGKSRSDGLDTIPEAWVFNPTGEMSAAQGTLPASYILTTEILGLRPVKGNRLLVEPHPADLTEAQGTVLMSCGEAALHWTAGDTFTAELKVPPGAEAVFRMPGKKLTLGRTGRTFTAGREGVLEAILPPGSHTLSVTN
jgi:hypothetical protein